MRFILNFILCLVVSSSYAASTPVLKQLRTLVEQHDYQAAFDLASEHAFELEGNTDFDFLYGLSALQVGKFEPALFSFERLTASYPQILRYRLELARSYFYLGNLDQAEAEFDRVLATQPPASVRQNIEKFKASIQLQRNRLQSQWQGNVTVATGYDSNINSATSAESLDLANPIIIIPGIFEVGSIYLDKDQRSTSSAFMQLRAMTSYSRPISRMDSWDMSVSANYKTNIEDSDYDLGIYQVQAGSRHLLGKWQVRPSFSTTHIALSGESYQQDYNFGTDFYWSIDPHWQPYARLVISYTNNHANDDLDRIRPQIETGLGYAMGRLSAQFGLSYAPEQKLHASAMQMKDTLGINLFTQYRFNRGDLYATALWQNSQYQGDVPFIFGANTSRDENFSQLLVGYRHNFTKMLSTYGQYSYFKNSGNIKIYEYQRDLAEVGVTVAF